VLGPIVHRTPITRGSHPACAVCAPTFVLGAPFCEANDQGPRPGRWPSPSLGSASRSASRLPSTALPRCLEFASTTDVSRHEHPSETPPPETTRRPPWGNPAGLRLRDPPRPRRFRRSCEKDAGPPRGHPASSSHVLDGTPPASGRPAFTCASARCAFAPVNKRLSVLFRLTGSLAGASPLTPLMATGEGSRNRASPVGEPGSIGARQCDPTFPGSRCLPSHETTFGATLASLSSMACCLHWPPGLSRPGMMAVTARAHRRSTCRPPARPSYRAPLFAGVSWAACAPTTSANECSHEHDCGPLEHPRPPNRGWDDCRSIESCPSIEGDRQRPTGSGVENRTESRRSPA
jgi:hypothetical protein